MTQQAQQGIGFQNHPDNYALTSAEVEAQPITLSLALKQRDAAIEEIKHLRSINVELLDALVCAVGALSGVSPISQEAVERAKGYMLPAIAKATGTNQAA